jgi:hypothetical protein
MSNDTNYTIRIEIDEERTLALERFLNQTLHEYGPISRKDGIVTYEHLRNLGPACAGRYEKDVEVILQEAAEAFPGASIDMEWSDEFGEEGRESFYVEESEEEDLDDEEFGEEEEESEEAPGYIDDAIAQRFLDDPDSIDLSSVTGMSDSAAQILAKHDDYLDLRGLDELTEAAAESLAKHQGELHLGGLAEVSDTIADSLAKHKGGLTLSGLQMISESMAETLARHKGGTLRLGGITDLTEASARALAKHKEPVGFNQLRSIPLVLAEAIAQWAKDPEDEAEIDFSCLESMDEEIARALSKGNYYMAIFRFPESAPGPDALRAWSSRKSYTSFSLPYLTAENSKVFAQYKGQLALPFLPSISEDAAKALSTFVGESLYLEEMDEIPSKEAAMHLLKIQALDENLREELESLYGTES